MSFKTSDKVVCVDAVPRSGAFSGDFEFPNGFVVHNAVYVVESIKEETFRENGIARTTPRLHLIGKPVFCRVTGQYVGWHRNRFHLLTEVQAENRLREANRREDVAR